MNWLTSSGERKRDRGAIQVYKTDTAARERERERERKGERKETDKPIKR